MKRTPHPHDLQNVGVRGPFLRDISKTLELRYAQDFEGEGVKKLPEERNNSRKDAKTQRVAKQTKEFLFALLCVFASSREIVLFFTASDARATCVGHLLWRNHRRSRMIWFIHPPLPLSTRD